MNRNYSNRLVILVSLLCIVFSSCNQQFAVDEYTMEVLPMISIPQWESTRLESGFFNIVRYNDGRILYVECDGHSSFDYVLLEPNFLQAIFPNGTGSRGSKYFDLDEGKVSLEYYNVVAAKYNKVAYMAWCHPDEEDDERARTTLIVHDAFHPYRNRKEFTLDCLMYPSSAIEESIVGYGYMFPFETVKFLDEKRLRIVYADSSNILKEEILSLE